MLYFFSVLQGHIALFVTHGHYSRNPHDEKFKKSMPSCEIVHLVELKLKFILRMKKKVKPEISLNNII